MRIRLPKGRHIQVHPFAVVATALAVGSAAVGVVSFGVANDLDAWFVGWGSNGVVAATTGYVVFRLGGGSLEVAPRGVRIVIRIYFWGGLSLLGAAAVHTAAEQGGAEAFHLVANNVAPAVLMSLVLGTTYLAARAD